MMADAVARAQLLQSGLQHSRRRSQPKQCLCQDVWPLGTAAAAAVALVVQQQQAQECCPCMHAAAEQGTW